MERCDVLIVGGGPAGSTCAWKLRRSGLRVVVMDAKPFPRDKVCAGWITPQIVETLELDAADYAKEHVLQAFRGFAVSLLGGRSSRITYPEVVSFGIRRCELDAYLLRRCEAELRLGEPLRALVRDGAEWVANGVLRAPLVVGAGGHFCPVARLLGSASDAPEPIVAAQELEFELDPEQSRACEVDPEVPELFFERDLRGYAWLVRKGRMLNIGIGRQDAHDLAGHARAFLAHVGALGKLPPRVPVKRHGHAYLLYGQAPRPLAGEGFLLIGDAAGLAWPQSGEGIRPAIESGSLAACAIAGGEHARYERAIESRFGPRTGSRAPAWPSLVPERVRPWLAEKLLARPAFARHVVVDGWFLHREQPLLEARSG
ncbi:MAG: NAD(P)/FAD-dependent oxidoreductase [Myxococcota bacterium]